MSVPPKCSCTSEVRCTFEAWLIHRTEKKKKNANKTKQYLIFLLAGGAPLTAISCLCYILFFSVQPTANKITVSITTPASFHGKFCLLLSKKSYSIIALTSRGRVNADCFLMA